MTEVSLSALCKTYPGSSCPAVEGFSLVVRSGQMTALLGPSGCGKSTVMKMIAGLLAPSSGEIAFDGRSVLSQSPETRAAVMVFQTHLLFPFLTVAENIGFGLKMRGLPARDTARRVGEMLERVQLDGFGPRRPAQLSGGQQQRVALARALILRPKVLLLDEPLSNLDAHLRGEMRDLICALQRETGITTLVVTHDQQEAVAMADTVALMLDGRLRQVGPPQDLFSRPNDAEVARFFGVRTFIPGTAAGGVFTSPLGPLHLPDDARSGPGCLTIRPENIRLGVGAQNGLRATILTREFLGSHFRLGLSVAGLGLEAWINPTEAADLAPGQSIDITLPRDALWVVGPMAG